MLVVAAFSELTRLKIRTLSWLLRSYSYRYCLRLLGIVRLMWMYKTSERLIKRPIVKPQTWSPDERARRRLARFCSLHWRIAVNSYACESLCLLGKPTDALKIIDGSSVNSNLLPTSIPSNDKLPMMRTSDNTRNDDVAELNKCNHLL